MGRGIYEEPEGREKWRDKEGVKRKVRERERKKGVGGGEVTIGKGYIPVPFFYRIK